MNANQVKNSRTDLREHKNTYIALLTNVPNGCTCRHTGLKSDVHKKHVQSGVGTDKGLFFKKNCNSFQTLSCSGNNVIFGPTDLVEVIK